MSGFTINTLKAKIAHHFGSIIFAINPKLLGDSNTLAWTNLGLWLYRDEDYISAAARLAKQMGHALKLKPDDRILDIGCGHGASLSYWHQQFAVQQISVMELQKQCCEKIQAQQLPYIESLFYQSFFEQNPTIQSKPYDVI